MIDADRSAHHVAEWLDRLDLGQYADAFASNAVTWELLRDLDDRDLRELGVAALGHRKRLLKAIAGLRAEALRAPRTKSQFLAQTDQGERRHLTVMFCDLVNSVALSLQYDPEDLSEIVSRYQACCEQVVRGHDGYVAAFTGDGLKAYFGYPRASEHDPERAIHAGLALISAVKHLQLRPDLVLSARVGIATGDVVVGRLIGTAEARERAVAGEAPNLARRLQMMSPPDGLVIAEETRELVGGLFEYADLGSHDLKGFPTPIRAWHVLRESRTESRFEATRTHLTPLVGRVEELGLLQQHWVDATAGNGRALLLSGEAGIGKSRLVLALRQSLAEGSFAELRYYCSPYHQNSSFYPIINQLRNAAGLIPDEPSATKLDRLEDWLARSEPEALRVAPLIASLLSISAEGRYPPLNLSPRQQKRRTMEALERQLTSLAATMPVLMVVEDLHWVDPSTREFLDRLIKLLSGLPVLLVMTTRAGFEAGWDNRAHGESLALRRLSRSDSGVLVQALASRSALPQATLEQILDHSDGVPLFLEELTKAALETGGAHRSVGTSARVPPRRVPRTLNASLVARLDRLAPWKEVAQIGAVIGRNFSFQLLAALFPRGRAKLEHALRGLVRGDIIVAQGVPPEATYRFKHALLQDAARASLLRPELAAIHGRIADVLERDFPDTAKAEPELLALHCAGAGRTEPAIGYWQKAAERALQRSANAEAVEHFKQALALIETLPHDEEQDRREQDLQTRLGATLTTIKGFAAPDVAAAYERARTLCPDSQDAAQRFSVLRGLWVFDLVRANWHSADKLAADMLELAEAQGNIGYELEGRRAAGITLMWRGELARGCDHLEQGCRIYDAEQHQGHALRYGNDPGIACLIHHAFGLWLLGHADRALATIRDATMLARRLAHPFSLAQSLVYFTFIHQFRREEHLIRPLAEEAKVLAVEHGFPFWLAEANIMSGWARAAQGDGQGGLLQLRGGVEDFLNTGARMDKPRWLSLLAEACAHADRREEGREAVRQALAVVEQTGECIFESRLRHLEGEFLLKQSDADATSRAESCFEAALAVARRQQAKAWELRAATSLASIWAEQGRRREAHDLLEPVYRTFTEGFDTADLKEARGLLDALSPVRSTA
jgi:predicted ATPase/class 3 adenylate cyclase